MGLRQSVYLLFMVVVILSGDVFAKNDKIPQRHQTAICSKEKRKVLRKGSWVRLEAQRCEDRAVELQVDPRFCEKCVSQSEGSKPNTKKKDKEKVVDEEEESGGEVGGETTGSGGGKKDKDDNGHGNEPPDSDGNRHDDSNPGGSQGPGGNGSGNNNGNGNGNGKSEK